MELTWQERLAQEPEWWAFENWPAIDTQPLPWHARRRYQRNARVVAGVLQGRSIKDVATSLSVSSSWVSQLMTRCLGGPEDAPPALTEALIPHRRLRKATRQRALATLDVPTGDRCAFSHLLTTVPGLEAHLMDHIRLAAKRSHRGQNLRPKALHALFIAFLDGQGWPRDRYPFTAVSRGYESIRRFLKNAIAELLMPTPPRRVIGPRMAPAGAFEEIQIDEAHLDCKGAAAVVLSGRMKPVRLGRISVLVARDAGTGCYLASTIALTAHPSAADILALLEQLIQPWQPLELTTPGLCYEAAAGFPSALHESFCRPAFGIVRLDNALAHLSYPVRRMVCDHLAATCNFGLAKNPKARALIEQAFRRLNIDIHRFPSTTGSHPADPDREPAKLRKEPPFVSLRSLEEAVSVLLTEYNHRPLGNQGAVTPLEQMHYQMANFLLPLRATHLGPGLRPFESRKTVTVRKARSAGAPRINFEGCQYHGEALNRSALINRKVSIVFDIRDIRQLQVSTLSGRVLGTALAPKTWQRFAHSLSLRKKIHRLVRENVLSARDPLMGWFNYTMAHHHLPREALRIMNVLQSSPVPLASPQEARSPTPGAAALTEELKAALDRVPGWSPEMAKKRR